MRSLPAAGSSFPVAVRLANLAAGIKVGKRGTASVRVTELIDSMAEDLPDESRLPSNVCAAAMSRSESGPMRMERFRKP
jgi:bifunctional ADP-heptose synthase (sugar kinase/adenylyltransferase)